MMAARVSFKGTFEMNKIAHSAELSEQIEAAARPVFEAAKEDPNGAYVNSLRFYRHDSKGRKGRLSWRIGAHPVIGSRVEAARGTLARALGKAGF